MLKKIFFSSLLITFGMLLGRVSGFVREIFVASVFGTTDQADIAVLLLTLPDLLLNILVGGALSAALVPAFVTKPEQAKTLLVQASIVLLLFFSVITFLLSFFSGELITLLAPGFNEKKALIAQEGVMIALWLLPLSVLSGVTTAYLQARNRFLLPSLGTLIFNGCIIIGLGYMLILAQPSLHILLIGLVGAGVCRYLSQLIAVRPKLYLHELVRERLLSRELFVRFFQAMFSGGVLLAFPVIARAFASYQGVGTVALFNYSMKLVELPLLLAITFISIVLLPRLSESYENNLVLYRRLTAYGVQLILALGVSVTAVLFAGVIPYVNFVFGNSLHPEDLEAVYSLVRIGLLSIVFQGITSFMITICNAEKKTHRPMYVTLTGAAIYILGLVLWKDDLTTERIMLSLLGIHVLTAFLLVIVARLDGRFYKLLFAECFFYCGVICVAVAGGWIVTELAVLYSQSIWLILPMIGVGLVMLGTLVCLHKETRELFLRKVAKYV